MRGVRGSARAGEGVRECFAPKVEDGVEGVRVGVQCVPPFAQGNPKAGNQVGVTCNIDHVARNLPYLAPLQPCL